MELKVANSVGLLHITVFECVLWHVMDRCEMSEFLLFALILLVFTNLSFLRLKILLILYHILTASWVRKMSSKNQFA